MRVWVWLTPAMAVPIVSYPMAATCDVYDLAMCGTQPCPTWLNVQLAKYNQACLWRRRGWCQPSANSDLVRC